MNMRGIRATPIDANSIKINVTSAQAKNNINRISFSPMIPVIGGYKGYWNFESYWQSGKVYEGIPREITVEYWVTLTEPKRRYPKSKGKNVLYATWDGIVRYDYITSRKQVYVPEYYDMVKDRIAPLREKFLSGQSITVYDFDGPRNGADVACMEITIPMLIEKINDPTHPFGHGYIVAAAIAGFAPADYI